MLCIQKLLKNIEKKANITFLANVLTFAPKWCKIIMSTIIKLGTLI